MGKPYDIIDDLKRAIREHLDSTGETQVSLVAKLNKDQANLDQANLSHFLQGKRNLSLDNAAAICKYLHLDLVPRH